MNPNVQVRTLTERDRDLILASDTFDETPRRDATERFLADRNHLITGAVDAVDAGVLIGFASGTILLHPDKPPTLFVNEVEVAEAQRRRGIGTRLCAVLMEAARVRGCEGIWLATEADNAPARALYRALGGRETAGTVVYDWDGAMGSPAEG